MAMRTNWFFAAAALSAIAVTSGTALAPPLHLAAHQQPAAQTGQIDLRPRFEPGQQIRYTLELNNTQSVVPKPVASPAAPRPRPGSPGTPSPEPATRSQVELGLLLRVRDVNQEREATVDIVLETIRMKIDGPDLTAEFDSTAKRPGQDDMVHMMLSSIVGTTMTATIDRTGNIRRITGGEQLTALGQVGMPGVGGGGGGGGGAGGLFGPIFSPKSGPGLVRVGESWENVDVIDSGLLGRFHMTTRHTLQRMQGSDAIVEVRGQYRKDSETGGSSFAAIKDSSYSGNYTWDTQSGSLKQMNTAMVTRAEQTIGEQTHEIRSEAAVKVTRN
jgi:hypothetical protein